MRSPVAPRSGVPRHRRPPRALLFGLVAVAGLLLFACGDDVPRRAVHLSELDNDIGPVTANFVDRALDHAENHDAAAWILLLDTPGGLVTATDDIVQRIAKATVPVAVYVSPAGARAASAGTFITMAAHVAAMAPSTQIGAATPVGAGGADIEGSLGRKILNDASADIRAIAQLRERNQEWAESAVREAVSATAEEAVELNVVDLVATDVTDLLAQIDGRSIVLAGFVAGEPAGPALTIRTRGAPIVETNMNFFENVLDFVADPNIAFLLITLGGLALVIELFSPGLLGPGIFGVIALLLGFFALGSLDTNPAGLALLAIALVLIVAEIFVAGFGVLGIGGIIALFFGGLLLISDSPNAEKVSLWLLFAVVAAVAATVLALFLLIVSDRRKQKVATSLADRMVGQTGVVRSTLDPVGAALVGSELWTARSEGGSLPAETPVRVVGVDGLRLLVEAPAAAEGSQDSEDTPDTEDTVAPPSPPDAPPLERPPGSSAAREGSEKPPADAG